MIASALLIFLLRITDVSIGTLRVLYTVRGKRAVAAVLGVLESGIFIVAIARVFRDLNDNPLNMVGYACGFATGTALGMTLEKWIASGFILVRIISREKGGKMLEALREANFGVTKITGEGREGPVLILFIVAQRKRGKALLEMTQTIDPQAFVTIEPVGTAMGGYTPYSAAPQRA